MPSSVLLLPGLFVPRFVLVGAPSATASHAEVPYNLWRSVPFCHSYNTSPGMCFRVSPSGRDGTHLTGGKVASGLAGTREEVRHQPT